MGRRVVDPNVGPCEGPVVGSHVDALLGSVQQLHPGLGQGLGRRAASCKPQVLGGAFHEDQPAEAASGARAWPQKPSAYLPLPALSPLASRGGIRVTAYVAPRLSPGQMCREVQPTRLGKASLRGTVTSR